MFEFIPDGHEIEKDVFRVYGEVNEKIVNKETGDWFFLTNREFKEINHSFANLPARVISELKKRRRADEPISILDIGGGIEARAAGDIADVYGGNNDDRVRVFSLDMAVRKSQKDGMQQIIGDALQLPIKKDSIDLAYSRQSVSLMEERDSDALWQSLRETARVLKPGGLFLLDKTFTKGISMETDMEKVRELGQDLGVLFYSKEQGSFISPLEALWNKLGRGFPETKFIIMVKTPIDERLLKSLKLNEKDKL